VSTIRVHELAKELQIPSKDLIEKLNIIGVEVKNHFSMVTSEDADKVRKTVGKTGASPKKSSSELPAGGVKSEGETRKRLSEEGTAPSENRKPTDDETRSARPVGEMRPQGQRPPGDMRPQGQRPPGEMRPQGQRPPGDMRPQGQRPPGDMRPQGQRPPGEMRPQGQRPPRGYETVWPETARRNETAGSKTNGWGQTISTKTSG